MKEHIRIQLQGLVEIFRTNASYCGKVRDKGAELAYLNAANLLQEVINQDDPSLTELLRRAEGQQ